MLGSWTNRPQQRGHPPLSGLRNPAQHLTVLIRAASLPGGTGQDRADRIHQAHLLQGTQQSRDILRQAERCDLRPIRSFASLRQDIDAATAGFTLPYSFGVVEGHVCRIKLLKRSMYGRASFALLRARILTPP
ncbi:transposase [Streptomyces sp. NPDC101165]|uniref:transposase n=1 Tax=Streptomyces sp. NPDC101165 TaxID=3366119 RepID=UPI00382468AF